MKKLVALALVLLMSAAVLAGCSGGGKVKTGLAVISSISSSKDAAADAEGNAQADSVVAAVLVDGNGKILACKLDTAQSKVAFTTEGAISTPLDKVFQTKQERGADYGMKGASSIGKEWNEQADAFAQYCVGKTLDQVKGIALNEQGVPADADLASSVTLHADSYVAVVAKAVENARELGAKSGDKLGLGVTTTIDKSKAAAADAEGNVQFYSYYTATSFDKSGKISSCVIDASQVNVGFTLEGALTTPLDKTFQTKQELGEGYGMKGASSIGKEWNEQADAFAKYVTGKTVNDVKGIALTEGVPSGTDLASSVTVHVTDFITIIEKAQAGAK